ncbi:MAG: pseudaminic acid cytidylyltransferase [Candidatus Magasanikbacteria bacterium]|nr:pseudaminic acid cytidylyltransferase [Candidatus Magasanikbacteria bacterium]
MEKNILAIITARGGSKRIPRKNIKLFLGQPIIKYSIGASLQAGIFAEVMVSTDDRAIADVAESSGATVPFFRSEKNSGDQATTADVMLEVLAEYQKQGKNFDYVCCLYPTAPFVTSARLVEAVKLLDQTGSDAVLPVTRFSFPIQRALKIESNLVKMIWPENLNIRSQDLMPAYHDCGQFYALNIKSFLEQKKLYMDKTAPLIIPESEVQDIDTEEDWKIAEMKYKILQAGK